MLHRRRFLQMGAWLGGGMLCAGPTLAAQVETLQFAPAAALTGSFIPAGVQNAIQRGLNYLVTRQDLQEGFFEGRINGRDVAVVGLAGLAFMASGSTPGRGPYGQNVSLCLDYILSKTQNSGFITADHVDHQGPMYGHGFATLFLGEAYGMSPRSDIREKLAAAVKLIIDTQNDEGGWRYEPKRADADISVTICQVMALRAARNAGIYVPNDTIQRCIDYVKRCQNPDGGFMYQSDGGPSDFARSAAGVVALNSAGIYEGQTIQSALDYLMQFLPTEQSFDQQAHFLYGHYYAAQAMWQAGGDYWDRWYPAVCEVLLARQNDDGSWPSDQGPEYAAAMGTIILQMPNNYLPIFQR